MKFWLCKRENINLSILKYLIFRQNFDPTIIHAFNAGARVKELQNMYIYIRKGKLTLNDMKKPSY